MKPITQNPYLCGNRLTQGTQPFTKCGILKIMDTVIGIVERITFYNEDNGYGVIKVVPEAKLPNHTAKDGTVTVVGVMPMLGVGENVEFVGEWRDDSRYGMQLRVEKVTPIEPTSELGITQYLSSGIVKGIGPVTAEKIVKHFGMDTINVLTHEPERLHEVPGLKTQIADKLAVAWAENYGERQTVIFLQGYGITARMARRIMERYEGETIKVVKENPYALADDVWGIGFLRADQLAQNMGIPRDSRLRLSAGLRYTLKHMSNDGHTYAPRDILLDTAITLLEVEDRSLIDTCLNAEIAAGNLIEDPIVVDHQSRNAIYLPHYYRAEKTSARRLNQLAEMPSKITEYELEIDWPTFLHGLAADHDVTLTEQQQSAVRAAFANKVSILTGGPGTGKTTTLRMVIEALEAQVKNISIALASPTGRAAKRLSEATGRDAFTIHRLLGFSTLGTFDRHEENPLMIDMLIVDEASMIDILLLSSLLRALKDETHLMLVGDIDQLPSVGAGNVLRDIIESKVAHVTRLKQIFRQSEDSHIILNAHRVNQGKLPFVDNKSKDFYFFRQEDPKLAANLVVDVVTNRIPQKFGYHPVYHVQVIAPMYRGPAGINRLNELLQNALNGETRMEEVSIGGRRYRVGDKVMQTKNNYDREVFNGDIGYITAISKNDNILEVTMDEQRYIYYDFADVHELILAYCISTHRSQGAEYPVVVMPMLTQYYMMLQRNLLYTAITRAKKMVVIVGNRQAIRMAVNNNKVSLRYSGLLYRIVAMAASSKETGRLL